MKRLKAAVVGCGEIAVKHLEILSRIPYVSIVALCDVNETKLKSFSENWKIEKCYKDFDNMLSREDLAFVDLCTPPQMHTYQILQAAKSNVNVLVEKPLTLSTLEAELIVDAVKKNKVKLCVIHNDKFQPGLVNAVERVRHGEIGKVILVHQEYLGTPNNSMLINKMHWCHQIPGGRIGECLPHPIYVMQALLGNDLEVRGVMPLKLGPYEWVRYDELCVLLSNRNGYAVIRVSFNAPKNENLIKIYGERGVFKVDLYTRNVLKQSSTSPERKVDKFKENVTEATQTLLNTTKLAIMSLLGRLPSGHEVCIRAFVDSILHSKEVPVSIEEAYHNVRICEEIIRRISDMLDK